MYIVKTHSQEMQERRKRKVKLSFGGGLMIFVREDAKTTAGNKIIY